MATKPRSTRHTDQHHRIKSVTRKTSHTASRWLSAKSCPTPLGVGIDPQQTIQFSGELPKPCTPRNKKEPTQLCNIGESSTETANTDTPTKAETTHQTRHETSQYYKSIRWSSEKNYMIQNKKIRCFPSYPNNIFVKFQVNIQYKGLQVGKYFILKTAYFR